jgi:hypothetical protein
MDREDGISNSRRFSRRDEILKMQAHRSEVARDENPIIIGCDPQDFRIESTVWNYARSRLKVS